MEILKAQKLKQQALLNKYMDKEGMDTKEVDQMEVDTDELKRVCSICNEKEDGKSDNWMGILIYIQQSSGKGF